MRLGAVGGRLTGAAMIIIALVLSGCEDLANTLDDNPQALRALAGREVTLAEETF